MTIANIDRQLLKRTTFCNKDDVYGPIEDREMVRRKTAYVMDVFFKPGCPDHLRMIHDMGCKVYTYEELEAVGGKQKADAIRHGYPYGFACYNRDYKKPFVFYEDKEENADQWLTLIHEMGHVVLGHCLMITTGIKEERQAEFFCVCVLAVETFRAISLDHSLITPETGFDSIIAFQNAFMERNKKGCYEVSPAGKELLSTAFRIVVQEMSGEEETSPDDE